jgi:predicted nucleotidyltransferase component of viral defense system
VKWEESNACTPLKRDFLSAWFAEERRFFLTGGSALALFYLDHRRSYDLDLFSTEAVSGQEIHNLVRRTAERIGAQCEALRTSPDFHRFRLLRGVEREALDVVIDRAPQVDVRKAEFAGIRVDTLREMTANKLTTLLHRAELKDVVDLFFLEQSGVDLLGAIP